MVPSLQYLDTTSAVVGISGGPVVIYSVTGISTDGSATVSLHDGTTAGGDLKANIGCKVAEPTLNFTIDTNFPGGVLFPNGCYAEITGATDVAIAWSALQ